MYVSLRQGSEIDTKDRQCRTPLLLATARGAWRAVRALLEREADFTLTDCDKRNVLHLALLHGGNLDFFGREFFKVSLTGTESPDLKIMFNSPI